MNIDWDKTVSYLFSHLEGNWPKMFMLGDKKQSIQLISIEFSRRIISYYYMCIVTCLASQIFGAFTVFRGFLRRFSLGKT